MYISPCLLSQTDTRKYEYMMLITRHARCSKTIDYPSSFRQFILSDTKEKCLYHQQ